MFVCAISNQSTSKNHTIRVKPSLNLIPCCKMKQSWRDHIFNQQNKMDKIFKKKGGGGKQYKWGLTKKGVKEPSANYIQ